MLLHLTCCAFSAMAWVAPASAVRADLRVVSDSQPVLTAGVLTQMTAFWTSLKKEPDSIQKTRSVYNDQQNHHIPVGSHDTNSYSYMNMVVLVAKRPSVAADFKQAGLTPQQWDDYYSALISALDTQTQLAQYPVDSVGPTSVQEKNIAFIKAHVKEITELKDKGLFLPIYNITFGQKTKAPGPHS